MSTIGSTSPLFTNPTTSTTSAQNNAAAASLGGSASATQSTFLQLLVAQLKNQDPTTPQDPTQFVSELAQFSQLEQTIGIRTDTDTLAQASGTPATGSTSGTTSTPPTN